MEGATHRQLKNGENKILWVKSQVFIITTAKFLSTADRPIG